MNIFFSDDNKKPSPKPAAPAPAVAPQSPAPSFLATPTPMMVVVTDPNLEIKISEKLRAAMEEIKAQHRRVMIVMGN